MKTVDFLVNKYNLKISGNTNSTETLVFAHGFGTDQSSWRFVKEAFANDYRLILYDNVGGGKSALSEFSPRKYSSLSTYALDLIEISDSLKLKDAVLVAHSVSSMIGLLASVRRPEIFSKLIFVGASPRYLNDFNYEGGFAQDDLESLFEAMTTNYYSWVSGFSAIAMRNEHNPGLGLEFAATLSQLQPDIALSVAKVIFQSDVREELAKLDKEVLIIQADNDIAVPQFVAEYLNRTLKRSSLINIDAQGHFPQLSAPDEVITAMKNFL